MEWPTLGSRTAKEQNRIPQRRSSRGRSVVINLYSPRNGSNIDDMVKIGHAVPELRSRTDRQPHTHTHTHRPIVLTGPPKLSLKHCLFCCRHSISCRIETKWAQSPITASICLDGRQFSVRHPFTTARASPAHRACKHLILYATPAYLVNKRREVRT